MIWKRLHAYASAYTAAVTYSILPRSTFLTSTPHRLTDILGFAWFLIIKFRIVLVLSDAFLTYPTPLLSFPIVPSPPLPFLSFPFFSSLSSSYPQAGLIWRSPSHLFSSLPYPPIPPLLSFYTVILPTSQFTDPSLFYITSISAPSSSPLVTFPFVSQSPPPPDLSHNTSISFIVPPVPPLFLSLSLRLGLYLELLIYYLIIYNLFSLLLFLLYNTSAPPSSLLFCRIIQSWDSLYHFSCYTQIDWLTDWLTDWLID